MEFTVSAIPSIKTLARVTQAASKIGDDLMLASTTTGLSLRTLSSSHSTCASFTFTTPFFDTLKLPRTQLDVKLASRNLLPIFRLPDRLASIRMRSSSRQHALIFTVTTSKTRLRKTYRVQILDGRLGKTIFSPAGCRNTLVTRASLFLDVLRNFHGKLDEITFTPVAGGALRISSFVHDEAAAVSNRILRTEMTVGAEEFDAHRFDGERGVVLTIFCKFFRAVLEFCDSLDSPLRMWYEKSGSPLLFDVEVAAAADEAHHFKAQFIFATRHTPVANEVVATASNAEASQPSSRGRGSVGRRTSSGAGTADMGERPPLATSALPPLALPFDSAPSGAGALATGGPPVVEADGSDATQTPPRGPSPTRADPPSARKTVPDSGPSHVSETPQSTDVDEVRPGPLPAGRSPLRRPKATDPHANGVTPLRKRRAMVMRRETPTASGGRDGSVPDEVVPDTPLVDADQEMAARGVLEASPRTRRGSLFESEEVDEGNVDEDEDEDDEYVAATPPPE